VIGDDNRSLEEIFLDEMVEGYLDGRKPDNPEPSSNRSASYRHGFANGRDDLAHSPRFPAAVLRFLADQAIKDDIARLDGKVPIVRRSDYSMIGVGDEVAPAAAKQEANLSRPEISFHLRSSKHG